MKFPIPAFFFLLFLCAVSVSAQSGDSDPVLQGSATYSMPQEAIDAGIDGSVTVRVHVDETGKPTRAELYAGPMWPCGRTPAKGIEKLKSTLSETILKLRFTPAVRNGKPVAWYLGITLSLENPNLSPKAPEIDPATGEPIAKTVSGGVLNGRAISLPVPVYPSEAKAYGDFGLVTVQVMIDEQGKVTRAGAVSGRPTLQFASRAAACDSKFSPTTVQGRPVKVSGVITYNFNP